MFFEIACYLAIAAKDEGACSAPSGFPIQFLEPGSLFGVHHRMSLIG
jgi:hypothetical protein